MNLNEIGRHTVQTKIPGQGLITKCQEQGAGARPAGGDRISFCHTRYHNSFLGMTVKIQARVWDIAILSVSRGPGQSHRPHYALEDATPGLPWKGQEYCEILV